MSPHYWSLCSKHQMLCQPELYLHKSFITTVITVESLTKGNVLKTAEASVPAVHIHKPGWVWLDKSERFCCGLSECSARTSSWRFGCVVSLPVWGGGSAPPASRSWCCCSSVSRLCRTSCCCSASASSMMGWTSSPDHHLPSSPPPPPLTAPAQQMNKTLANLFFHEFIRLD